MTRHSTVATFSGGCPERQLMRAWISKLSWSIGAAAHGKELGSHEAALLLPLWGQVDVDGDRFQARVLWDGGEVARVDRGRTTQLTWRIIERGQTAGRQCVAVTVTPAGDVRTDGPWPVGADAPLVEDSLATVVSDGELAEWTMLDALEPFVRRQLYLASLAIGTELGAAGTISLYNDRELQNSVIDGLTIDRLAVGMLFGHTGSERNVPAVTRDLIRKYASDASAVACVPLTTYLETNVRRQADGRVRSTIGDPMLGPRIRRIASTLPAGATAEEVLARCVDIGISGNEPLGIRRVRDALTTRQRVAALAQPRQWQIDEYDADLALQDHGAAEAFENVDATELVRAYQRRLQLEDPDELWLVWQLDVGDDLPVRRDVFHVAAIAACTTTNGAPR